MGFGAPAVNLHSPTAIGDVTPNTIAGTTLTSNAANGGGAVILQGFPGSEAHFGGLWCGVTPGANNYIFQFDVQNNQLKVASGEIQLNGAIRLGGILIWGSATVPEVNVSSKYLAGFDSGGNPVKFLLA